MTQKPWLKNYPAHVAWDQKFDAKPLYTLVDDAAAEFGDCVAYDFMGKETTYNDLLQQVNRMARGLQDIGVGKGVHVGIFMPNCPQFSVAYFGILKAGGTVVNYSPLYSEQELINQVEETDTDIMITLDLAALYPQMEKVCQKSRLKHLVVDRFCNALPFPKNLLFRFLKSSMTASVVKDRYYTSYEKLMDNEGNVDPVNIDVMEDVAVIQSTGGTTGIPKGAMLTHSNLFTNVLQLEAWAVGLRPGEEVAPGFLPFFHVFAMTVLMNLSIRLGAKVVIMPKFELEAAMKMIKKYKPTLFAGVPTMFTAMLNHKDIHNVGIECIRVCLSGGAPLPVDLGQAYKEKLGLCISEGYGLTESSPVCGANPFDRETRYGSIGLPMPGTELIIVDREDPLKEMPLGEHGEICIRGPQVMKGYYKRPEATAEVLIDGMFRTGDVGYMDEDGYTYIVDRDKDLVLVGGFNVYPRTVEEAIYQHPAVNEVTVIGVPDEYLGERPKAFVSLKNPDEPLTEAELMAFIHDKLGKHERPKAIEFRKELPKTMIGKLSKKELVAEEREKYEKLKASA
ncbi:long-chain-fatty-acid--CoA ligase [Paremcibacter congregatus]|uniref:Dicarboxylate--CoA ligase PimA n=1 Tax=Paremcibacter congregatus TaxID=2043170 RepID=A0A2G4YWM9_9PROT|nr:long-chain fatty acid--CoA ligase [Paremcibacter congregatus]PHZ85846.1 dicarboxylate--CoA ligase PimA [Paremcibacter congregatus]QDE26809.1 long-chain fatty acid--CoA ligase [Paremcibacter congregatus]